MAGSDSDHSIEQKPSQGISRRKFLAGIVAGVAVGASGKRLLERNSTEAPEEPIESKQSEVIRPLGWP